VVQPLRIAGRVIDTADAPVAGARITQWDTANTTTTDASGAFEMTGGAAPQDRSFWVTVEKAGFETSELARNIDTASNASLRVHKGRTMTAGGSALAVAINSGPAGFPQPLERQISVPVKSGSDVVVDISAAWDIPAAAPFTLKTVLAP
jgi:hypothetical protein